MAERPQATRGKVGIGMRECPCCQLTWALMLSDLHAGNWRRCPRCHWEADQAEKRIERVEQKHADSVNTGSINAASESGP